MLPTKENINAALALYDKLTNWKLADEVISKYINANNENKVLSVIATKVVLINSLYFTVIYAPLEIAKHIENLAKNKDLDLLISNGKPEAVELISDAEISGTKRRFLSFATKYCHFHNPDKYPIFDAYVYNLLKKINGRDKLLSVNNGDLKKYRNFYEAVVNLKKKISPEVNLKDLDKYLWLCGQAISKNYKVLNKEVRECFMKNEDPVSKLTANIVI